MTQDSEPPDLDDDKTCGRHSGGRHSDTPHADDSLSEELNELSEESAEKQVARQAREAYTAAIRLLAPRDHSTTELRRKLQKREHTSQAIESAFQELMEVNYLNDARYAELYAEQRMNRGYGPMAIRAKLRERGIESALSNPAIANLTVNWSELAEQLIHKRFNSEELLQPGNSTTARVARMLQARGFSSGDALRALKSARKSAESESQE